MKRLLCVPLVLACALLAMNSLAYGPPSWSISAVGARLPVSPKRLTSSRKVMA